MADQKISKENAQKAFDKFDVDNSGSLDANEFFELAGKLGMLLDKGESEAALAQIDSSKDGKIQFDEFYTWLSTASPKKKGAKKMAKLRGALLTRRGVRFVGKILGGEPVEGATTIECVLGNKDECKKNSVSATLMKGHVIDVADKNVADEGLVVTIDIAHNSESFPQYAEEMLKTVSKIASELDNVFHVSSPDAGITRITAILPGEGEIRKVAGALGMVEAKLAESAAKIDLGFDFADIAAEDFGLTKKYANAKVSFNGIVPAEALGLLNSGQLPPMVMEADGVQDLAKGEKKVESDLTNFFWGLFDKWWPQSEFAGKGMKEAELRELLRVVVTSMGQRSKRKAKEMLYALAAFKIGILTVATQIKEVQAVHVRNKTGYGLSVELKGFELAAAYDTVSKISDFMDDEFTKVMKQAEENAPEPVEVELEIDAEYLRVDAECQQPLLQ